MSSWSDLVEALTSHEDEGVARERLADLWIFLAAHSGSYASGAALAALADVDVVVRATSHVVSPVDERLSQASLRFLTDLVGHSSGPEIDEWIKAARRAQAATEPRTDPEEVLESLRSALVDVREGPGVVAHVGSGKAHLLVHFLAERLSPDDRLTAAAELAALHPDIEPEESGTIRALLATVAARDRLIEELAGAPRHLVGAEDVADSLFRQARITGEAMASIWEYPMFESSAAAVALGAKPSNRERVRSYRERSWLLGLPKGRGYAYPQFQFDAESHDVYVEVRRANELLGARRDPWGVASWWIARNDRLDARPVKLIGTSRASEVELAAQALLEPVG